MKLIDTDILELDTSTKCAYSLILDTSSWIQDTSVCTFSTHIQLGWFNQNVSVIRYSSSITPDRSRDWVINKTVLCCS